MWWTKQVLFKYPVVIRLVFVPRTFGALTGQNVNENIVSSSSSDVVIPETSLTEWLYAKMEPFHKYTAVECAQTAKSYTYRDVIKKSNNLSKHLRKNFKLGKGDAVAVLLPNCPDYFVACLGCIESGVILTSVNPIYNSDEIATQLQDVEPKVIITESESYRKIKEACLHLKRSIPILCIKKKIDDSLPEGVINFEDVINTNLDFKFDAQINHNDVAFLPYSSGTTGLPKGVELTHRNLIASNCYLLHPDYTVAVPPTDNHQDISAAVIPLFHIYGFCLIFLGSLCSGMKVLTFPKFSPDAMISGLKNHKINILFAVPPLVLFLTHHPGVKKEYLDSFKIIVSGGAPLGSNDEEQFSKKIGRSSVFQQGYGLTETTGCTFIMLSKRIDRTKLNHKGSCGIPVPNTLVKIIRPDDVTGKPLGANEEGEVLIKGPQVMKSYYKRPEQTKEVFLDGWFKTGDIGHYNEDGLIFITDRLKELIKVKGFQVAPAELETIIRGYPKVKDAGVIGVPHPTLGEVPRAYVVTKDNENLKPEEITNYVAGKVSKFKHLLGGVEIIDEIPKSVSGKILRKQLKQEYIKQLNK